ncbi:MAG: M24 family metallopeptidase, partial [Dongiaceae bacterium]
ALVIAGRSDLRFRGRVLYACDVFQYTADSFAVLTAAAGPFFVTMPVVGLGQALLTGWATEFRSSAEPGQEAAQLLADHGLGRARIGIVGLSDAIAAAHLRQIEETLPAAELCDATRLFETVRRRKSPEEVANLRETSAIFRKIFAGFEPEIRPGTSEADIAGCAARGAKLHGCRDIKTAMGTSPFVAISYGSPRRVERDDQLMIWIETPGPNGYWLELRRCYSFGPPPDPVRRYFELQQECWQVGLAAMRPGTTAGDVLAKVAVVLRRAGYGLSDGHFSLHGIGTDAIEGIWAPGNDGELLDGEVVSFHPSVTFTDEAEARQIRFIGMTDNVLVTPQGGVRLTYDTDRIVEL